jgi:lysophospholipase L1-like esterase
MNTYKTLITHKQSWHWILVIAFFLSSCDKTSTLADKKLGLNVHTWSELNTAYLRRNTQIQTPHVYLFGSSHIAGLYVHPSAKPIENYGIGGETSSGLAHRLPMYNIQHNDTVVIQVGGNDFNLFSATKSLDYYKVIINRARSASRVIWISLLPVSEDYASESVLTRIKKTNIFINNLCEQYNNCHFLDADPLLADNKGILWSNLASDDHIHLNLDGYDRLRTQLEKLIDKVI